jgi:hypothetical protein
MGLLLKHLTENQLKEKSKASKLKLNWVYDTSATHDRWIVPSYIDPVNDGPLLSIQYVPGASDPWEITILGFRKVTREGYNMDDIKLMAETMLRSVYVHLDSLLHKK